MKNFLSKKGIPVLKWPGNSPDLNPIENMWMYLKRKVHKAQPRSLQEMINVIKREWVSLDVTYCSKLAASMPRRIEAVLKAKGASTKY